MERGDSRSGPQIDVVSGSTTKVVTLGDLAKLPVKEVVTFKGDKLSGPTLRVVLEKTGVNDFRELVVVGSDGFTATLTAADVTDDVVIGISDKAIMRLGGPKLAAHQSVKAPVRIAVK